MSISHEDISRFLGKLEGKLDAVAEDVKEIKEVNNKRLDDHSSRLRKVENKQNWFAGVLATITSVGGGLTYFKWPWS